MTDTLVVPYQPSTNSQGQVTARILSADLGDGYKLELADGINALTRTYSLTWDMLPEADAKDLTTFLDTHVGTPFFYRLPRDQAPRTLVWKSYNVSHPYPFHDSVTVSVEERFIY